MNNNRTTCDPEQIELFLQQKLSDEEQAAFELHLDDCGDCRQRLEATAAGDDVWSGVRDSLLSQQLKPDSQRRDSALDSATGDEASSSQVTVLKVAVYFPRPFEAVLERPYRQVAGFAQFGLEA